ncbi:MAG: sigma-70 family RNA polymerase sigma factor, partial [Prolixibacteraceae bacterium]|nr:sigma-70 family RNA polymerase sigma factor [Prolixibacteraceae bacterium]
MTEDQQLLSDLKNEKKKQQAFRILVDKYKERLYWHIRKIVLSHDDADDVLQETFIKIWQNISSFRADSGLYTWIYRIATNESLSFLSQKKRKYINNSEEINDYLIENLKADPYFSGDEIQMKLQKAIA